MKVLVLLLALALPLPLAAQEVGRALEQPRVFSIQERPYRLGHEFQLGLGVLPLNAFYVGAVFDASYTYHFSDFWAWEILNVGYSVNFDTSLEGELLEDYGVAPVGRGGDRIKLLGTTSVVVKPLFGKLALWNERVLHAETFFTAGFGPIRKGETWLWSSVFGIGLRLWTSEVVSVRFDLRDYLALYKSLDVENSLLFMLSASFNVFDRAAAKAEPTAVFAEP